MTKRWPIGAAVATAAFTALIGTTLGPAIHAQEGARPITAENFERFAPRGFNDQSNTWAQSMAWWRQHVYVGTVRESLCVSLFSIWQYAAGLFGRDFADTWLPYPPPNSRCIPDASDFPLQAEIWRWGPGSGWVRVFQSPLELDNPGPEGADSPFPGKKLPYEVSIRGMTPHRDPDGTEALYAFGVNSTIMWDRTKLPPPRILRTTDGQNFTPLPQTPGTFLGDLPHNPDHSSFRSPVSYRGKLFVISGPVFGQGSLIGSADPAKGDDAWFLASPPELLFYDTEVFEDWLYLGTFNLFSGGYSVVKTRAEGAPPYQFITVIPPGAFLPERPSKSVVSMHVYNKQLYVGTATQTELIRINADDTWDLVVGTPREVPAPGGGTEWKYPISGLDAGFGHTLNDHAWQMDDPYRYLYIGTYNASIASRNDPVNGPLLAHNMGAHLYRTRDGWYFSALTTTGFSSPSDPQGGPFDYGIRTMVSTSHGVFLGTANDSYGLMIFRAASRGSSAPDPPARLEIDISQNGSAILSWQRQPRAQTYQVWRAEVNTIYVRDELNFENWNGASGTKIPDTYVGPYEKIGETPDLLFIDGTVQPNQRYMYYVLVSEHGRLSDQSNLVAFPLLTPPVTFAQLTMEADRWAARGRFIDRSRGQAKLRDQLLRAQAFAAACEIDKAVQLLNQQRSSNYLVEPEATDLDVLMSKLVRRLVVFDDFRDLVSDEFCTSH